MTSALFQRPILSIPLIEEKRELLCQLISEHEWDLTHPLVLAVSEELDLLILEQQLELLVERRA